MRIIIVSYNTSDLLRNCLQSVFAQPPSGVSEVVVVDNASADDSVTMVRRDFPQVRVLANETNVGYAAAINMALTGLTAEYALILNSDIEVDSGALDVLMEFMTAHPRVGMTGPRLVLPNGRVQETWRHGFSLGEFAGQQLLLDKVVEFGRSARAKRIWRATPDAPQRVDHIHGAALLVRAAALEQVGPMDEGYWMYCEDSDWCLRFRRAGWELFHVPASRMLHHHGASSKRTRAEMIAAYNLAAARYFRLHEGPLEGLLARWLGLWGTSLRLLGAMLGSILTIGLYDPLTRRAKLFARALALQASWRNRWLQPACIPVPDEPPT